MKNILFIVLIGLLLSSCSSDDDGTVTCYFPIERHFYIELINMAGEIPEDGEVLFQFSEDSGDLIELTKVIDDIGITIFGLKHSIGTSGIYLSHSNESGVSQNTDTTETYFIHYNDNTSDTLTVRKYGFIGDSELTFEFRLNGDLLDTTPIFGTDVYFTIVKDIEWENVQEN